MSDIIARHSGLELDNEGLIYSVRRGWISSLRTGVTKQEGYTPIQHVNAIEIETRRAISWLIIPLGALLGFAGDYLFYFSLQYLRTPTGTTALIIGFICFLIWLFVKETCIVVYSEGTAFVAVKTNATDEAVSFVGKYRVLKGDLLHRAISVN